MANQRKRPAKVFADEESSVAVRGSIKREHLPYSWVHYPNHYGVFHGFSKSRGVFPVLCNCAKGAVSNYLKLYKCLRKGTESDKRVAVILANRMFPDTFSERSFLLNKNPLEQLEFKSKVCHRCNMATPSLRWCHPMYGGQFKRTFGWYIQQVKLRLGVLYLNYFIYLEKECPDEVIQLIESYRSALKKEEMERARLMKLVNTSPRRDIKADEVTYWYNVKIEEAKLYNELKNKAGRLRRQIDNYFENITREEFGFRKIGDSYVSESLLYKIIRRLFPNDPIIRHHRPDWLNGLELDVFLPDRDFAIEYQGQQHFYPVKAWGGEKALFDLQKRDERKRVFCEKKGVILISIDYIEPLTENHLKERIKAGTYKLGRSR